MILQKAAQRSRNVSPVVSQVVDGRSLNSRERLVSKFPLNLKAPESMSLDNDLTGFFERRQLQAANTPTVAQSTLKRRKTSLFSTVRQ
jgi:hypothetical protein